MKVKANQKFEWIVDSTIGRVRVNGEEFEVDEDRAKVLLDKGLIEPLEEKKRRRRKEQ